MRKTNNQIDQLILQAILSCTSVYNIAEVSRISSVDHRAVKKRIGGVFGRILEKKFEITNEASGDVISIQFINN